MTCNPKSLRAMSLAAVMVSIPIGAAGAQSVCVSCEGPRASYNCVLELPEGLHAPGGGGRVLQLACIEDIARRYGHERCQVRRGAVGPCIGETHALSWRGAGPDPVPGDTERPTKPAERVTPGMPAPTPRKKQPTEEGPPKTVVEMAERAGKVSQRQLNKAGKAVEGAVKKTWRCISSLFSDC